MTIKLAVKLNKPIMTLWPLLNFLIKCTIKYTIQIKKGRVGGNILKEFITSPCSSNSNDR